MATAKKVATIAEMNAQEAALSSQEAALSEQTTGDAGFWSDNTPSNADVNADIRLRDLRARQEKLQSNLIARDMYGLQNDADTNTANVKKPGVIMRGLDILSRPLYGVVGAASYLSGKGDSTFGSSVMTGVKNKETWGGLLKRSNVSPSVAMTLGFGMDVLTDPVNLLSGGAVGLSRTGAGKVVKGAVKAGAEGAAAGAKASATKTLYKLSNLVPGLSVDKAMSKTITKMVEKGVAEDSPEFLEAIARVYAPSDTAFGRAIGKARIGKTKLEAAANRAGQRYDSLVDFDINRVLETRANRESVSGMITEKVKQIPGVGKAMEGLKYSSNDWSHGAKLMDEAEYALEQQGRVIKQVFNPETGRMEAPRMSVLDEFFKSTDPTPRYLDPNNLSQAQINKNIGSMIDESADMLKTEKVNFPDTTYSREAIEQEANSQKLWEQYTSSLKSVMKNEDLGAAQKLNDFIEKKFKIKDVEVGKKILDAYDIYRGLFITSKISSLSPSSMIYAILGNPTMNLMYGFNTFHPDNFNRTKDALAIVYGSDKKRAAEVLSWMTTGEMADFYTKRAKTFVDSFGVNLNNFGLDTMAEKFVEDSRKVGAFKGLGNKERQKAMAQKFTDTIKEKGIKAFLKSSKSSDWVGTGEKTITQGRTPTGYLQNELQYLKGFSRFKKAVDVAATEGTGLKQAGAKALNFAFRRSADFQKVDQVFKLKDFMRMVRDGITERELLKITNNFLATNARISPEDIASAIWKGGEKYFKIKPDKAMEIANDIYMNYAAMPAFIRALRALPIVGSPFFAFTYAMLQKTSKAALNNPAAFNKVNFLLQEISKDKTPLEREALKSKYYSYLGKQGMINLGENIPFFKGHPVYLNLAQMIPYYSLNIINPSERGFNDDIRGQVAGTIDRSPLFKDPVGQLMLDYLILPSIIRDQDPVNMWGGPLYEKDASAAKKAAYAARSFGESLVPSSIGAAVATPLTDEQMKWLPSYPGRKFGFATRGKTAVGVMGKEDPASRGLRAALSLAGVNLYPMDLTNISSEIKKRQK